jgi:RNA polymerase sigma factor (sigma-70 family)
VSSALDGQGTAEMPQERDPRSVVEQALAGDAQGMRVLVDRLSPVIARRVASTRWRVKGTGSVRQDAADLVQDVFLSLFQNNAKALRAWDPERGMSLESFVGLLAQHQVISLLRSGRASAWREDPADMEEVPDIDAPGASPEALISSRERLSTLLERVRAALSPRGLELFQRMFIDEEPIEELVAATGMTRDALYQWRTRLHRSIRTLAGEIDVSGVSESAMTARIPKRMLPQ